MTTENKLINQIMEYWEACAYRDGVSDFAINDLVEKYALLCGINEKLLEYNVLLTVRNMANSQKRKLYKLMLESGIRKEINYDIYRRKKRN